MRIPMRFAYSYVDDDGNKVDLEIELDINKEVIARRMAGKCIKSKSGRASAMKGAIKAKMIKLKEPA